MVSACDHIQPYCQRPSSTAHGESGASAPYGPCTPMAVLDALVHLAPVQLGHAGFGSRRLAVPGAGEVAQAVQPEDVRLDLRLRHALAHVRSGAAALVD